MALPFRARRRHGDIPHEEHDVEDNPESRVDWIKSNADLIGLEVKRLRAEAKDTDDFVVILVDMRRKDLVGPFSDLLRERGQTATGVAAVFASLSRHDLQQMLGPTNVPQLQNPPPGGFVWVYSNTLHGHGISLVSLPSMRKPPEA